MSNRRKPCDIKENNLALFDNYFNTLIETNDCCSRVVNNPSIPTDIIFVSNLNSSTKIISGSLTWTASMPEKPPNNDGITTIIEYDISYSAVSLNRFTTLPVEQKNLKAVETRYNFTVLNPDATYNFKIQAKNSGNKLSGYSSPAVIGLTVSLIPKTLQYNRSTINNLFKGTLNIVKDINDNDVRSKIIKITSSNTSFNFFNTVWPIQTLETRGNKYNNDNARQLQITNLNLNTNLKTTLAVFQLPGFEKLNTIPNLSNNSITINGRYDDSYPTNVYIESYQQYYMELFINNIQIPESKFTASINSQTFSIADSFGNNNNILTNNNDILTNYCYDGTYNFTGPQINTTNNDVIANSSDDNPTSITKINGNNVYYNLTLRIQTKVSNIGTYFYRSPVLEYFIVTNLIVKENDLSSLISEDDPNSITPINMIKPQVKFDNFTVKLADINTTNISSVTIATPTSTVITLNINGYNAFYNNNFSKQISLLYIIDQPSYNLAYNTIKSNLSDSNIDTDFNNNKPFRILSSIYNSLTVLTDVITDINTITIPFDNTKILINNSDSRYNNELPIINGGFCFPSIYDINPPDQLRYVTYAWKMASITSGKNILSFLFDCNESFTINGSSAIKKTILQTVISNTFLDIQINIISINDGIVSEINNYFGRWIYGSITAEPDIRTGKRYNSIINAVDVNNQYFLFMDANELATKKLSYSLPKIIKLPEGKEGYILLRVGMKKTNFQIFSIKAAIK